MDISRREFCAFACLGVAFAGCVDGDTGAIETGGLNGVDTTLPPDAGTSGPDGGTMAAACTNTFVDVGLASTFVLNTPKVFGSPNYFFVVRDAGGLYALTQRCPHKQVLLNIATAKFHCPSHGADFKYDGTLISGPTTKSLIHYAMCTLPGGKVGVQPAMQVPATTRLVA